MFSWPRCSKFFPFPTASAYPFALFNAINPYILCFQTSRQLSSIAPKSGPDYPILTIHPPCHPTVILPTFHPFLPYGYSTIRFRMMKIASTRNVNCQMVLQGVIESPILLNKFCHILQIRLNSWVLGRYYSWRIPQFLYQHWSYLSRTPDPYFRFVSSEYLLLLGEAIEYIVIFGFPNSLPVVFVSILNLTCTTCSPIHGMKFIQRPSLLMFRIKSFWVFPQQRK